MRRFVPIPEIVASFKSTANQNSIGAARAHVMKLPHRRQFLNLTAGAAALPVVSRIARAQSYPSRPVRILVGFPAGGTSDIVARVIGQRLSERLGQQFVVENRPGAGSNLATEAVARATPDGYTLLLIGGANTINATLFDRLNFEFLRDIAPVASVFETPLVVEVNPSVPVRTISEFITYAKGNPGKLNFATPGVGTPPHVAGELFKMTAGVDIVHVPYRGTGPMLTDLCQLRPRCVAANYPVIRSAWWRRPIFLLPLRCSPCEG
jgi:tripartite-type tricarboxylate transporter receptor subunit TctC